VFKQPLCDSVLDRTGMAMPSRPGSAPHVGPKFAEVASQFLEAVDGSGWTWRCAWPNDGAIPTWVEQYRAVLQAYNLVPSADHLVPTIGRIWGALRDGDAVIIIDQETRRAWAVGSGILNELPREDVVSAMVAVAHGSGDAAAGGR
jgi:hypothetical protein